LQVRAIPKPGQEIPKTVKVTLRCSGSSFSNQFGTCRLRVYKHRGMTRAREQAFSPEPAFMRRLQKKEDKYV
jgi:hypothetical protein